MTARKLMEMIQRDGEFYVSRIAQTTGGSEAGFYEIDIVRPRYEVATLANLAEDIRKEWNVSRDFCTLEITQKPHPHHGRPFVRVSSFYMTADAAKELAKLGRKVDVWPG